MVKEKAESEKFKRITITIAPELYSAVNDKVKKGELSGVITSLLNTWVSGSPSVITDTHQCISDTNTPDIPPEWVSSVNGDIQDIKAQMIQNEKDVQSSVNDLVRRALYGETPDASVNLQPLIERIEDLEKSQNTGPVKVLLMEVESLKNRMSALEEIYDEGGPTEEIPDAIACTEINNPVETSPEVTSITSDVSQVQVITESVPEIPEPDQEEDRDLTEENVTPGRLWQPPSHEVSGDEGELPPESVPSKGRKELFKDRISLTSDIKAGILKRFEEMKDAGLSKANIAGIMGYKRSTSILEIESDKCSTIPRQGYEALMAWSP